LTGKKKTNASRKRARHTLCNTIQLLGYTLNWRAMLFMLHGVTGGPATSRNLEIWCQVHGQATQWGCWYTLQYCSQDNSRASTDHGSLTCYMRGISLLTVRSKHFAPHGLCSWLRWLSSA